MSTDLDLHIRNYTDYREFLAAWYSSSKSANKKISFRYIARNLGLGSPNHFHLVISKQRHLSKATLARMQTLLRLNSKERSYLNLMHAQATCRHEVSGLELAEQCERLRLELKSEDFPSENYALLSNSLAWFIRMGALRFEGQTRETIMAIVLASCPFPLCAQDIDAALALLLKIGAVKMDGDTFRFEMSSLKTDWDFDDTKIKQFHRENLQLALHTIPWPIDQRFLSNATFPCTNEMLETVKAEVRGLCLRLLELSQSQVNSAAECQRVMSLQFALFPYFSFDAPSPALK